MHAFTLSKHNNIHFCNFQPRNEVMPSRRPFLQVCTFSTPAYLCCPLILPPQPPYPGRQLFRCPRNWAVRASMWLSRYLFVPKHTVSICQRDRAGDESCFPAFWSGRLTPCNPRSCLVYDRFTSLYRPCFFGVMSILFCASKCFSVSIQNFVPFSKFVDI